MYDEGCILEIENATLRAAMKACEDCDAVTIGEVNALHAQKATLSEALRELEGDRDFWKQCAEIAGRDSDAQRQNVKKLLQALKELVNLDDGDQPYWWQRKPESARINASAILRELDTNQSNAPHTP